MQLCLYSAVHTVRYSYRAIELEFYAQSQFEKKEGITVVPRRSTPPVVPNPSVASTGRSCVSVTARQTIRTARTGGLVSQVPHFENPLRQGFCCNRITYAFVPRISRRRGGWGGGGAYGLQNDTPVVKRTTPISQALEVYFVAKIRNVTISWRFTE